MTWKLRFALAALCAVAALVLCVAYGNGVRADADRERSEAYERYGGEVATIVVATAGLEAGDVIGWANVTEQEWLTELIPDGAITSTDDVLGRRVTNPLASGAPLTQVNIREATDSLTVPGGYVAISIPASDRLGVPSSASVGSQLVAYQIEDGRARLLTSDVVVLRLASEKATLASGSRSELCVAVRPGDVSSVLSASTDGTLRLALPADGLGGLEDEAPAPTEVAPQERDAKQGDTAEKGGGEE